MNVTENMKKPKWFLHFLNIASIKKRKKIILTGVINISSDVWTNRVCGFKISKIKLGNILLDIFNTRNMNVCWITLKIDHHSTTALLLMKSFNFSTSRRCRNYTHNSTWQQQTWSPRLRLDLSSDASEEIAPFKWEKRISRTEHPK